MSPRSIPTLETTTLLWSAPDKRGVLTQFRLAENMERENRGFISHEISAWQNNQRAGYLRIGFVPSANLPLFLPTVWHHMSAFRGWCTRHLFEDFHGKAVHPKTFDPQTWAEFCEAACFHIRLGADSKTITTFAALEKAAKPYTAYKNSVKAFADFRAFHVDRPLVDYICTRKNTYNAVNEDYTGRGIGLMLYAAGAHHLAKQGFLLHGSGNQSESAQAMWDFFTQQGWVQEDGKRRQLNPKTMPTPDTILSHTLVNA